VTLELSWLPPPSEDWASAVKKMEQEGVSWSDFMALAGERVGFLETERLDRIYGRCFAHGPPSGVVGEPIRLALLGSSTLAHLRAGIRIAAARRGLWASIYEAGYGQYLQESLDENSALYAFRPNVALIALDARHLAGAVASAATEAEAEAALDEALVRLELCWSRLTARLGAAVIQQTLPPVFPHLLGANEHRLAASPARAVTKINAALRERADHCGVSILNLDERAAQDGVRAWCDPALWLRAKQEISPIASPLYGDLVARLLAATQGRSKKCLVLDLDNTLWGGVVGDDGLDGIVLGQGDALGEAYLSVQSYVLGLARRGVILAVCSKNDAENAYAPFDRHPEMILRRDHIASFVANWDDKATNLRRIAQELNIGLDSLVFLDDNPFERNFVRKELPQVAVPEIADDDPTLTPQILADAGYFESLGVTDDDRARTAMYRQNRVRAQLQAATTDLPAYLRSLEMELEWRRFDSMGLARTTQLINKTNQFNLRTRRYTEAEAAAVMDDPRAFGLQLRLEDRLGDNGVIAVVIGLMDEKERCVIDTWLMSCRVLGRMVEQATLNVVAEEAMRLGATQLVGEYLPTPKNVMVAGLYEKLGFSTLERRADGSALYALGLTDFQARETLMHVRRAG
jgi:FkbH-like protein